MVLVGDEAQLEDRFCPFADSVNLDARSVHGLRRTYHSVGATHSMVPLGDVAQVEAHFYLFRDSANLNAR